MEIDIYTDGGCSGNPGPGGWGFVLLFNGKSVKGSGRDPDTTNNRMELTAVIEALKCVQKRFVPPCTLDIKIHTDSTYVKSGITSWIVKWVNNGWKTSDKKDVKNRDLWIILKELSDFYTPQWIWVKGHSGNKWNEECDNLVKKEIFQ